MVFIIPLINWDLTGSICEKDVGFVYAYTAKDYFISLKKMGIKGGYIMCFVTVLLCCAKAWKIVLMGEDLCKCMKVITGFTYMIALMLCLWAEIV